MSKSLGNFVTIHELLRTKAFGGRSWPGPALRLAMLRSHYRQPIDWTARALEEAEKTLLRFARVAAVATRPRREPTREFVEALGRRSQHAGRAGASATCSPTRAARRSCGATLELLGLDIEAALVAETTAPEIDDDLRARIEALVAERLRGARGEGLGGLRPAARRTRRSRRGAEGRQGRHHLGDQAMSVALRPYLPADARRCAVDLPLRHRGTRRGGLLGGAVRGLGRAAPTTRPPSASAWRAC